jgi:hypothetical protein
MRQSMLINIDRTSDHKRRSTGAKLVIGLALLALIGAVIWSLPHGYSTDLSAIGKGQNTVVLVHDHGVVHSLDVMHVLDSIRADYSGRIEFLVADLHTSQGQAFAQRQDVGPATLLLFGPDGRRLRTVTVDGADGAETLRQAFSEAFQL